MLTNVSFVYVNISMRKQQLDNLDVPTGARTKERRGFAAVFVCLFVHRYPVLTQQEFDNAGKPVDARSVEWRSTPHFVASLPVERKNRAEQRTPAVTEEGEVEGQGGWSGQAMQ